MEIVQAWRGDVPMRPSRVAPSRVAPPRVAVLVTLVVIGLSMGPAAAAVGSVADDCMAFGVAASYQAYARDVAQPVVAAVRGNLTDPVLNKVRAQYGGIAVQDRG